MCHIHIFASHPGQHMNVYYGGIQFSTIYAYRAPLQDTKQTISAKTILLLFYKLDYSLFCQYVELLSHS